MADDELLGAFEGGRLEGKDFPHEAHVRVTWLLAQRDGRERSLAEVVRGIRDIARRAGRPEVFHETITRAWFELIAQVEDIDAHPELADRDLCRGTTPRKGSRAAASSGSIRISRLFNCRRQSGRPSTGGPRIVAGEVAAGDTARRHLLLRHDGADL